MKKWLALLIFTAYVHTPLGVSRRYQNVESYQRFGEMCLQLTLTDGKIVVVPAMFTVIEEK